MATQGRVNMIGGNFVICYIGHKWQVATSSDEDAVGTQMDLQVHGDLFVLREEREVASVFDQRLQVSTQCQKQSLGRRG
jgi:hypothetical protein